MRRPDAYPQRQADRLLLARYSPPGVIVNERFEVIEFRGRTGVYLEPPPGKPRGNLLVMTHDSLVPHLHDALERAKAESSAVRQEGVEFETGSQTRVVNLEVVPLPMVPDAPERHFLVVFEEPEATPRRAIMTPVPGVPELSGDRPSCPDANAAAKDYLYSLFSEQQVALEELAVEREEMMVTVRDLQDTNDALRMRNEEAERVANEVADVLSAVEIPIILLDPELKVRRFTRTVGKIAGLVPSDIGRSIHDLRLKLRVDDLAGTIRQVIESASPFDREVQGEDGHWYRVQMRPCINSENQLDAVVLSFIDVDGLRCAVRNAERDCAYAHGILDSVSTAVVVLGVDMRVVSANGAFHALFESSPASVHQSVRELDTDLWRQPALLEPLEEALSSGKPFAGLELEAEVGHLGRRVLRLTCHPLPANNGCARISLVIEDLTELRSLETEKSKLVDAEKRARFAAERANHAKDVFLATLSHELRTPLSTILMSAEILKRVAVADRNVQKASTAIERSATMQVKLVDDLLDVARIASGKLVLEEGSVNLAATVQEAVACARPAAEAKRVELSAAVDEDVAPVYGDGTRLQQVVTNLLNNAIKFTPSGGRISVRLKAADGRGEITVTDTGEGIRPELLPHLFERFVQAETSPRRAHGGLGLGLSIVRHLVELHGGEVHAESRGEGQGATFRVTLPLGVRAGSPTSSRVVARGIGGVKVLLVEDDEDSRDAYATMLGQLGADVMAAPSANQGLTAMREFHPQVIIADIVMPGEDGLAFIQRVRQLPPEQGGQTPAAALSAMASQEDRQRSMQLGYQMHVAKPVDSARLAAIVNVLVESRRVATG